MAGLARRFGMERIALAVVAAVAGCHSTAAQNTPVAAGIDPAGLYDPNGYGDSPALPMARDLFRVGERIRMAQRPAELPAHKSCLVLSGGGAFGAFQAGILVKLEGSYVMISGEEKGDKLPETAVKNAKLTIEGDKCTVKVGDETVVGIHKLDPTKKPKAIDRKDTAGMFKGKTALGIYKLEKGEFTICFAAPGKERPTEFTTKSGTGVFLYVWKQQEGWVYHSKEHGFSMKLPSSYWREAKSKSLVAFTHVSLPMKAFVTSVKQGPKETFEASVQRLKDFLDKNGDQLLQKPEVVEQEDKAGNKRWCVVLKEKGRDGAEYMLVGISYTWIKEKGITIETEFEGSMTAKSNYFKALEKESFEKSVKEICLSVE